MFAIAACAISWAAGLPLQALLQGLLPPGGIAAQYLPRLGVLLGPALAGLLLARPAPRRRSTPSMPIAAALALAATLAVALSAAALIGRGGDAPRLLAQHGPALLAHLAWQVLFVGLLEEFGWRGRLLPALLARGDRPLAASLRIAPAWLLWHLPALGMAAAHGPTPVALLFAAGLALNCLALSVLLTAAWRRGGVLLAAIVHGGANAPQFVLAAALDPWGQSLLFAVCGLLYSALAVPVPRRWHAEERR